MQHIPGYKSNTDVKAEQRPININKPPIGVAPGEIVINRRIHDLAGAITRYADKDGVVNYTAIELWAKEIELHCKTITELQRRGKDDG